MASSIVTSTAQQLGGLLVEEARYLYEVSDKIERLQRDLAWMQCFLEDADNRQNQEKMVAMWVDEIRDFAYEAEDIIERYLHEVSHPRQNGIRNTMKWFFCVMRDAVTLHDVGSNIDDLRIRISELMPRMQMYGIQIIRQPESSRYSFFMREQRRTYPHTNEDPVGLENHIEEVVNKLVNNEVKVVGIFGMGGLGKTTLTRKVFSHSSIRERFKNNCVWVYISKEFDKRDVFEEILIGLGIGKDQDGIENIKTIDQKALADGHPPVKIDEREHIKKLTDGELPVKIDEVLKKKECLVVLDDIWENHSWDTLKPAFQSIKTSGSKILITTRKKNLLQYVDPSGYHHPATALNEKDSWILLRRRAFPEGETRADAEKGKMEELGKKMLEHCNGLPLAIVALGGMLATRRTVNEWETIHENITSYFTSGMGQESEIDQVMPVLELSYYDLPFYLKPCFLYLGIFPEDFEISAQRLYHLWEAEGLVTTSRDHGFEIQGGSLDDIAESYLEQLVDRCMVQVDKRWPNEKIKSCRFHDVMRDMCLKRCKEVNFLNIVERGSSKEPSDYIRSSSLANRKLRRCAIYLKDKGVDEDSSFDLFVRKAPYIRSLLVFPHGSGELGKIFSRNMWKYFSLLRVLVLQGTNISKLPKVIGNCIHLRYLSLKDTSIVNLPSWVFDFKYLETLDLRCWEMKMGNDFQKIERLRHLYLPVGMSLRGFRKLKLSPKQLHQMETLKNFDMKRCQVEDLEKMVNLRIFSFTFFMGSLDRKAMEVWLKSPIITRERLRNPLRLSIEAESINERPTMLVTMSTLWIKELNIRGELKVPVDDSCIQIFPHTLTRVVLWKCEIGKEGILELEKLPHLKQLELWSKAVRGNKMSFSDEGFPQLAKLGLYFICDLEEWEVGEGALPNLRYLFICRCEKLKKIPEGLPSSAEIVCDPCINGIEKYNTCPHFKRQAAGS